MPRRGRDKGERFPKIHPVRPAKGVRNLSGVSRFGSKMRPGRMAAWLDRYAREQDRLAEHEPVATPARQPRYMRALQAPRPRPDSVWTRLIRWLRNVWNGG